MYKPFRQKKKGYSKQHKSSWYECFRRLPKGKRSEGKRVFLLSLELLQDKQGINPPSPLTALCDSQKDICVFGSASGRRRENYELRNIENIRNAWEWRNIYCLSLFSRRKDMYLQRKKGAIPDAKRRKRAVSTSLNSKKDFLSTSLNFSVEIRPVDTANQIRPPVIDYILLIRCSVTGCSDLSGSRSFALRREIYVCCKHLCK